MTDEKISFRRKMLVMVEVRKPGIEFTSGESGRSLVVVCKRPEDKYLTSGSSVICTVVVDVEESQEMETREMGRQVWVVVELFTSVTSESGL